MKTIFNKKNILLILIFLLLIILIGCESSQGGKENENEDETELMLKVEYDEVIYYSQKGMIKVNSLRENDEITIESLNTKVIKIDNEATDDYIAIACGLGEAEILISNLYGDDIYITIKVEAKGEFAPPIEKMDLKIVEEGPYYVGETYHLDITFYPEVFNDTYRYILSKDNDYVIDQENNTVIFNRSGNMILSVFAEGNAVRDNLQLEVNVNPNIEMYEVLFIGNSLTYVHDIPSIIENMITADGVYFCYSKDLVGGSTLESHETAFNNYIEKYNFSHVILQGQSIEPINNKTNFMNAIQKFGTKAKEKGAQVIVYETWAYNKDVYNGLPKYQMTEGLKKSYEEAANLLGAKITRSGEAFKLFEETYGITPTLYQDLNHQNLYGAYLSACVHYSTLTGKKASENSYKPDGIELEWIIKIRKIADLISFGE